MSKSKKPGKDGKERKRRGSEMIAKTLSQLEQTLSDLKADVGSTAASQSADSPVAVAPPEADAVHTIDEIAGVVRVAGSGVSAVEVETEEFDTLATEFDGRVKVVSTALTIDDGAKESSLFAISVVSVVTVVPAVSMSVISVCGLVVKAGGRGLAHRRSSS